jgi:hypothetical protein
VYRHFCTKDGKTIEPTFSLVVFGLHHVLGLLVIPMNVVYGYNPYYWQFVASQQFAAGFSLGINEYTYFLDVKTKGGLKRMVAANFLALVGNVICRGGWFAFLSYKMIVKMYQDKHWAFLIIGTLLLFIFFVYNWLLCIIPYYERFMKFYKYDEWK